MDGSGKCERSEEVDRGDERSHVFFFISSLWRRAGVVRIVQSVGVQQKNRCAQFVWSYRVWHREYEQKAE